MTPGCGRPPGRPDEETRRIRAELSQLTDECAMLRGLLAAVLTIGAELELEPVLHRIVEVARGLVRARYGAMGVLNEQGQFTEMISSGFCGDHSAERGEELPHGDGLIGDLVRDPRPLRVDDLATHPGAAGFPQGHPVMTTLLGVPIRVRQEIYGNLYLADKADGPFTREDQEMVMTLAGAAGLAIDNARLYQRTCRATEDFQRRLLPEMPHLEGWELQARFAPSSRAPCIGGDWYDLICLPDDVPCLVIGDVMGHDVQAAIMMSQISNMLRVVTLDEPDSPGCVLCRLDRVLHRLHGGPMATVLVARMEQAGGSRRRLRWTSAGHLPPLLAVPGERARYLYADVGVPLGVDPDLPRTDNRVELPGGAAVLLHTDGLVEHRDRSLDEGMDQIIAVATAHAADPLAQLCDAVLAHPGGAFEDDVALLAVRPPA